MACLAVCLLVVVTIFFWGVVMRNVPGTIDYTAAHIGLLVLLLLVIAGSVLIAHAFLRHALRPLRMLSDGVARVGAGDLDAHVPRTTRDEFGTLTDGFNDMVGRVRDMIAARDQLLIDVSHELRSPLTRMKVALELLADDGQRARLAADIGEMEQMIAELLELERLRTRRGLRTGREDLMSILRDVADRFDGIPPGIRIVTTSGEIVLDLDGEKVCTVVRNLLENA